MDKVLAFRTKEKEIPLYESELPYAIARAGDYVHVKWLKPTEMQSGKIRSVVGFNRVELGDDEAMSRAWSYFKSR